MRKKKILITGVAGMIGSHLLERLLESGTYEVIGIDNLSYGSLANIRAVQNDENFQFYRVDIADFDTLKILSKGIHTIIHLAAVKKIGEKDSSLPTLTTNVKGTENVLEAAKMWGCKVIFASTSDVYGMSPDLPYREDSDLLLGPSMIKRWSYAVSKLFSEQQAFAYHQDYGLPLVVLRYFGGFSPRSSFQWSGGHLPIFIAAILRDEEVIIHGDGSQTRSMAFVSDLVDGTVLALENENAVGRILNLGNDEELSVLETAELIHEISRSPNPLRKKFVPMSEVFGAYKDIMRRRPDLSLARDILGYQPKVSLREGIRRTIEELRSRQA